MTENTVPPDKLKGALRLAAELCILVWGLLVCNLAGIGGGMLTFESAAARQVTLWLLLLPLPALALILPVMPKDKRLLVVPPVVLVVIALFLAGGQEGLSIPLQNMKTIFALDNMAEVQRKREPKGDLVLYATTNPHTKSIHTLVREESKLGNGLLWVKIVRKPEAKLFD